MCRKLSIRRQLLKHGSMVALACLLAAALAQPVAAKQRTLMPDLSDLFQPAISMKDAKYIHEALTLSEPQRMITNTLLADYEATFSQSAFELHARLSDLQPLESDIASSYEQSQQKMRTELRLLWEEIQFKANDPQGQGEILELQKMMKERTEQYQSEVGALKPLRLSQEALLAIGEAMVQAITPWQVEQQDRLAEFEESMVAILDQEQVLFWPSVRRGIRRTHDLPQGLLSGESIDLANIISKKLQGMGEASDALLELIENYERSLDEALIRRMEFKDTMRVEYFRATLARDDTRIVSIIDQEIGIRMAIRNIQDQYAAEIEATLEESQRRQFIKAVRREGYPRIYRSTRTHLILTAAVNLGGLDTPSSAALERLYQDYQTQLADITDQMYEKLRANEPRLERIRLARRHGVDLQDEEASDIRDEFSRRTELDQLFMKQLEEVLSPEQLSRLSLRGR